MDLDEELDDDATVNKYGMTNDLERRMKEHDKAFGKHGIKIQLVLFSYIDVQYISKAESDLSEFFDALKAKVSFEKHTVLVVMSGTIFKAVKKQYELLGKTYLGHVTELVTKINNLENTIAVLKETHAKELAQKDVEIANMRTEIAIGETKLSNKENELLKLKTPSKCT